MTKRTPAALALAAAVSLLAPAAALAETYAEAVLADAPVAYYRLDGDAADAGGNGHDAAVAGGVTFDADGPTLGGGGANGAARFAGGSLELDAGVRDALDGKPAVTVEAWVKLSPDAEAGKNSVVYVPMRGRTAAVELSLKAFPDAKGGAGRAQLLGGARSSPGDKFAGTGAMGDFAEWRHVRWSPTSTAARSACTSAASGSGRRRSSSGRRCWRPASRPSPAASATRRPTTTASPARSTRWRSTPPPSTTPTATATRPTRA